jgi:hypothetical protein
MRWPLRSGHRHCTVIQIKVRRGSRSEGRIRNTVLYRASQSVSQSGTTGLNGPPPRQWPPEGNDQVLLLYRVYSSFNIDAPLRSAPLATAVRRPEHHFPVRQTGLQTSMYSTYCKSTVSADTSTSTRERSREMPMPCQLDACHPPRAEHEPENQWENGRPVSGGI